MHLSLYHTWDLWVKAGTPYTTSKNGNVIFLKWSVFLESVHASTKGV